MDILRHFGGVGAKYRPNQATAQGYPVISEGGFPNLRGDEFDNMPIVLTVKVKVFDLSKPDELAEYTAVRDRIANRSWIQLDKTKLLDPSGNGIKIHLEWCEPAGKPTTTTRRG